MSTAGNASCCVIRRPAATDPANLVLPAVEAHASQEVLLIASTGGYDSDDVIPAGPPPA